MLNELITLIVLICLSAFFSGVETAFVGLTHIKLHHMLAKRKKNADVVARLKEKPQRLITTILIGNNIVNIALSAISTKIALDLFGSTGVAIAVGIVTLTILIFGEITPKSLAIAHAEKITLMTARPLELVSFVLFPLVIIFEGLSILATKITGGENKNPTVTEEELKTMIEIGEKENIIEQKEKEFIEGVLEFNDITAREVMTPRVRMFALSADIKIKDALPRINKKGFSRIPIYKGTRDKIVGVVHIKDILNAVAKKKTNRKLSSIAADPVFVTENRIVSEIFKEMQEKRTHLVIIVDEYGGTEGIIALEDLLEEIVGEIMDESDLSPEMILRVTKNVVVVHGDTEVDDVNDFFHVNLPVSERYNTVNGLFHHKLRRIPRKNATLEFDGVTIKAQEVSKRKILKAKITKT